MSDNLVALPASPELDALLLRAECDPNIQALVLTGSWARAMATKHSDLDVYVVLAERDGWVTTRSNAIDLPVCTVADLRSIPEDPNDWWERYSFRDAQVLFDRSGGEIARLVRAQATLTSSEAARAIVAFLDGYMNFAYRSLKAHRDGRAFERRVDAAESIAWMLPVVFAIFQRVRPYNQYLRYELETHPVDDARWAHFDLVAALERMVETDVRRLGFGETVDG